MTPLLVNIQKILTEKQGNIHSDILKALVTRNRYKFVSYLAQIKATKDQRLSQYLMHLN